MSLIRRREISLALVAIGGIIMISDFFINVKAIKDIATILQSWGVILAIFCIFLSAGTLIIYHVQRLSKHTKEERGWSGLVLLIMSLFVGTYLAGRQDLFNILFNAIYLPTNQAIYGIIGFFLISASYRAFKVRSLEASLLLISGCAVILKNAPIGSWLWEGVGPIGTWFNEVGGLGGNRGFIIAAALGAFSIGIRVLMGLQKGFAGGAGGGE